MKSIEAGPSQEFITLRKLYEWKDGLQMFDPTRLFKLTEEQRQLLKEDILEAINGINGAIRELEEDNMLSPEYNELSHVVESLFKRIENGM